MPADTSPLFGVRVFRHESHTVVQVVGEIDLATAPQLRSCLDDLIADADGAILLDLADVTYIDSTGVSAVLTADAELNHYGRDLRVVEASVQVRRLFELCGITELVVDDPQG